MVGFMCENNNRATKKNKGFIYPTTNEFTDKV